MQYSSSLRIAANCTTENPSNQLVLDNTGVCASSGNLEPTLGLQHGVLLQIFNEPTWLCQNRDAGTWCAADTGGTVWSFAEDGSSKTIVLHSLAIMSLYLTVMIMSGGGFLPFLPHSTSTQQATFMTWHAHFSLCSLLRTGGDGQEA